jgi:hypothetical protein
MYVFDTGYYEKFLKLFQERKVDKRKKGEITWV